MSRDRGEFYALVGLYSIFKSPSSQSQTVYPGSKIIHVVRQHDNPWQSVFVANEEYIQSLKLDGCAVGLGFSLSSVTLISESDDLFRPLCRKLTSLPDKACRIRLIEAQLEQTTGRAGFCAEPLLSQHQGDRVRLAHRMPPCMRGQ